MSIFLFLRLSDSTLLANNSRLGLQLHQQDNRTQVRVRSAHQPARHHVEVQFRPSGTLGIRRGRTNLRSVQTRTHQHKRDNGH
jgi:hypothetical protein